MDGAGGAAGGSYESIQTITATAGQTSATFNSIPSTYKHLQIRSICRDNTGAAAGSDALYVQFNSDSGTNYAYHGLKGNGSTASAYGAASQNLMLADGGTVGGGTASNVFGVSIIDIQDYSSTTKNKTIRCFSGANRNVADTNDYLVLNSGLWLSTSSITSIKLSTSVNSLALGSVFSLYGIKG